MTQTPETQARRLSEALGLILALQEWADHKRDCSIWLSDSNPASDYCSCGYGAAMNKFKQKYEEISNVRE